MSDITTVGLDFEKNVFRLGRHCLISSSQNKPSPDAQSARWSGLHAQQENASSTARNPAMVIRSRSGSRKSGQLESLTIMVPVSGATITI